MRKSEDSVLIGGGRLSPTLEFVPSTNTVVLLVPAPEVIAGEVTISRTELRSSSDRRLSLTPVSTKEATPSLATLPIS